MNPKRQALTEQMESDALRHDLPNRFQKGSPQIERLWLDSLFSPSEDGGVFSPSYDDEVFLSLIENISRDPGLLKLYVAVSFARAADESVRRGVLRDLTNTILQDNLLALNRAKNEAEIRQVISSHAQAVRTAYATQAHPQYSPLVRSALEIIWYRRNKPISAGSVAAELNVERSTLAKRFQAETHKTITQTILTVKMEEALRLQNSGLYSLHEISELLSFPSYAYFSRRYKSYFGHSPSRHFTDHSS